MNLRKPSLEFEHEYEVEILTELPSGDIERFYFPGGSNAGGPDGLLVRVTHPKRAAWLGVFEFGVRGMEAVSSVMSCPDPRSLLVVASGLGVAVRCAEPTIYQRLPVFPIVGIRVERVRRMILIHDYTTVAAIGEGGLIWRTNRLSWDGIKLNDIEGDSLVGVASDPTGGKSVAFRIDLLSGTHSGGTGPDS